MPRGFVYAIYTADDGRSYLKQVDLDQVAQLERGWTVWDGVSEVPLWPQRAVPRMVYGVSPSTGRRGHAIVASTGATLWTGVVGFFTVETNDPALAQDACQVTRRRGESFPMRHQIVQPLPPAGP